MTRRPNRFNRALLLDAAFPAIVIVLIVWCIFHAPGCATVRTVADVGHDLCRVWMAEHPERAMQPDGLTCDAIDVAQPFVDAINLAAAKPQPESIKEALAAHPPLSSAAALALPCIAPPHAPIDEANPYREPQSRIERRLYPFVVEPPARGE